jgi:hypothetical protein
MSRWTMRVVCCAYHCFVLILFVTLSRYSLPCFNRCASSACTSSSFAMNSKANWCSNMDKRWCAQTPSATSASTRMPGIKWCVRERSVTNARAKYEPECWLRRSSRFTNRKSVHQCLVSNYVCYVLFYCVKRWPFIEGPIKKCGCLIHVKSWLICSQACQDKSKFAKKVQEKDREAIAKEYAKGVFSIPEMGPFLDVVKCFLLAKHFCKF